MSVSDTQVKTAAIASGASLSGEIDMENFKFGGIVMPGTWTTAGLTFAVCNKSGGTFVPLYDDAGVEVSVTAAASTAIGVATLALALAPWRFIKIRSGTVASAVNQGGDRVLELVLKA